MSSLILREDLDGLVHLRLNRPEKLNALTVEMFAELDEHVQAIDRDVEGVGVVVLSGAGRCFSAGNDLNAIASSVTPPVPNFQAKVIERLAELPQPVIVAVHGHCYTGALELALAGDLIVAAESARFADTHAKWALTPLWGMGQRLRQRVGPFKAREMMFLGRTYTGAEALAMGLANFCVPDDLFHDEVARLAQEILAGSWFTHRANKRLLVETDGMSVRDGLAYEVFHNPGRGPDMQERIARFRK